MLGLDHAIGNFHVEAVQRLHRRNDLRLYQPSHFEHLGTDGVQVCVELAGQMFIGHGCAPIKWSGA